MGMMPCAPRFHLREHGMKAGLGLTEHHRYRYYLPG